MIREERSFGIIPFALQDGIWRVFLILHQKGNYWSFPKGKAEENESFQESAIRELKEETGLSLVRFLQKEPLSERYHFQRERQKVNKTVLYYPAIVEGKVVLQSEEVRRGEWLTLSQALDHLTFSADKSILKKSYDELTKDLP